MSDDERSHDGPSRELAKKHAAPRGRTSKLTPERSAKLIELIKHGNYVETAAAATGIDQRTYYGWVAIGKAVNIEYGSDSELWPAELSPHAVACGHLFQGIRMATAEAEATAVLHIKAAMPKHWQAAMAYLERRFPDRWRRRDEIGITNPLEGPKSIEGDAIDEAAVLSDPQAVKLMHEALALVSRLDKENPADITLIQEDLA